MCIMIDSIFYGNICCTKSFLIQAPELALAHTPENRTGGGAYYQSLKKCAL